MNGSHERRGWRWRVEPGMEEEFRHVQGWLAASDWLDRLIEATEPREPVPVAFAEALSDLSDGSTAEAAEEAAVRVAVRSVREAER